MENKPKFNEIKTTEAVSIILNLAGGKMKYIHLLKILYMSDRKSMEEWGRPITFDNFVSMDYGQVNSITYNLIKGKINSESGIWENHINSPTYLHWIEIKEEALEILELSRGEIDFIETAYEECKGKNPFEFTHKLPEYVEAKGSSIPTEYEELLGHLGFDKENIKAIVLDMEERAMIEAAFEGIQ